jgi:hypothetical protein
MLPRSYVPVARFQTVIKRARFVYSPYTATEMQRFAQVLTDSIRARIQSGQNIYDQAAAPLKPGRPGRRGYPDYKTARGLQPIRDWTWSGHTLRCLKVLTANENRAAIGLPPDDSPATAEHNLGHILLEVGRVGEAEQWLVKALDLRSHLLGDHHPATRLTLQTHEKLLRRNGRKEEARRIRTRIGLGKPLP